MNKVGVETDTFHHSEFKDIGRLLETKHKIKLSISLCMPTLNEEKTIAEEIVIMKSEYKRKIFRSLAMRTRQDTNDQTKIETILEIMQTSRFSRRRWVGLNGQNHP